jgi:hypothetical protein
MTNDIIEIQGDSLFLKTGFDENEVKLLIPFYEDCFKAIGAIYKTGYYIENNKELSIASQDLFVHKKKYHINLFSINKSTFWSIIEIVGLSIILYSFEVVSIIGGVSASVITGIITNISKLNEKQIELIRMILILKKENPYPDYNPTSINLSEASGYDIHEIFKTLNPLIGKVVKYKNDKWSILY